MAFNRKQKLRDNIEAIRTAFILDRENRTATTEERAILQRYCGFGGLKCILNPAKELTDAVRWAKSDLELFAPTVELHRLIRENSKDETEYKRFVDSLKASVLTAFYTPKEITDTIADVLADYSVRPARMLEPSAGVGVFVDSMLRHSPNADVMAFEKDLLTGTILRHLYPDQKMRTCGFEKIERPFNNYFDLAVSNIPFGDIAVFDAEFQRSDSFGRRSAQKTIHNYFFLKGLDAVRDGGIVSCQDSKWLMSWTINRQGQFKEQDKNQVCVWVYGLFTDVPGDYIKKPMKDCTVKNIDKVRINFKVATTLRLVNDSVATTKGAPNNINFELVSDDNKTSGGSGNGGGNAGGEEENPLG